MWRLVLKLAVEGMGSTESFNQAISSLRSDLQPRLQELTTSLPVEEVPQITYPYPYEGIEEKGSGSEDDGNGTGLKGTVSKAGEENVTLGEPSTSKELFFSSPPPERTAEKPVDPIVGEVPRRREGNETQSHNDARDPAQNTKSDPPVSVAPIQENTGPEKRVSQRLAERKSTNIAEGVTVLVSKKSAVREKEKIVSGKKTGGRGKGRNNKRKGKSTAGRRGRNGKDDSEQKESGSEQDYEEEGESEVDSEDMDTDAHRFEEVSESQELKRHGETFARCIRELEKKTPAVFDDILNSDMPTKRKLDRLIELFEHTANKKLKTEREVEAMESLELPRVNVSSSVLKWGPSLLADNE